MGAWASVERAPRSPDWLRYSASVLTMFPGAPRGDESLHFAAMPSWSLVPRWPYPRIPYYATTADGTGLLTHRTRVEVHDGGFHPDLHMRDLISSLLLDCLTGHGECICLDIGANIGFMSLMMLQLNASVVAIEPQPDFARALSESARYNGWSHRLRVLNGGATHAGTAGTLPLRGNYRYGAQQIRTYGRVPTYPIDKLLVPGTAFKLIKIDTDAIDCELLHVITRAITSKRVSVHSITLETSGQECTPTLLGRSFFELSQLGFQVYRIMMPHRRFNERGWDEKRNYQPLGDSLPPFVDEVMMQRSIRYMWRVHQLPDIKAWASAVEQLTKLSVTCQFLVTREALSEPFSVDEGFACHPASQCAKMFSGLLPSTRYHGYKGK